MISSDNLGGLMGAPVFGPDDDKIGTIGQVFVDPVDGHPNWVTVHTGLFGRHETFIPLDGATWDREALRVAFDKQQVKDAPRIDTDAALDAHSEDELYRYYSKDSDADDQHEHDAVEDVDRDSTPISASDDDTGSMRLRKYVVTDARTEDETVNGPVVQESVPAEDRPVVQESVPEEDAALSQDEPRHRA